MRYPVDKSDSERPRREQALPHKPSHRRLYPAREDMYVTPQGWIYDITGLGPVERRAFRLVHGEE